MKKCMRTRCVFLLILCYLFFSFSVFAQNVTIESANNRTAMRCLDLSRGYLLKKEWQKAFNQAEFGLNYTSDIADLWYIKATALTQLKKPIADILKPLQKAVLSNNWIYWNSDSARLMLAEIYVKTGKSTECLELLNTAPELVLREAQYLRAQALYNIGDVLRARAFIAVTASIYSDDSRFPMLFFTRELMRPDFSFRDSDMVELATVFLKRIDNLRVENTDILLYASQFTQCQYPDDDVAAKELSTRILKSWKVYDKKNWLYAIFALKSGLISQQTALEYLSTWFENSNNNEIQFTLLEEFSILITDTVVAENFKNLLEAFSGTITFDLNKDTIVDMGVLYEDGRPKTIVYDKNQDGILSWLAECDIGVPYKVMWTEKDLKISYRDWPAIASVQEGSIEYDLVPDELFWSPVQIIPAPVTSSVIAEEFYIPTIASNLDQIYTKQLYNSSNIIIVPSTEKENALIRFTISNGEIQSGTWLTDSQSYAFGVFKNGILEFRNVDMNLDGFYEICEIYGYDPENIEKYTPLQDSLFGTLPTTEFTQVDGLYLSQLIIDNDLNSIPEYTELFLQNGGRLCTWYNNDTEKWDYQYVEFQDGRTILSRFRNPVTDTIVEIEYEGAVPVQVIDDGKQKQVFKDPDVTFYWIGKNPGQGIAKKLQNKLNLTNGSSVYKVVISEENFLDTNTTVRLVAVSYGNLYFGEIIER